MTPTKQSDNIQDFINFLTEMVGSTIARNRTGATRADIEQFKALVKLPLPPLYLDYLHEFGQDDGIIKLAGDGDPRLTALIEFYLKDKLSDSEIPEHGVVIGRQGLSGQRSLLYSEAGEKNLEEPKVVLSWWGEVDDTLAKTFRNYLYRRAFINVKKLARFPLFWHQEGAGVFLEVIRAAIDFGFQAYWFSDDWQGCLEMDDGAGVLIQRRELRVEVFGYFTDARARDDFQTTLAGRFVNGPGSHPSEQ